MNAKSMQQISSSVAESSQTSRNYPHFTELKFSLPFSKQTHACANPESYESTPRPSTPIPLRSISKLSCHLRLDLPGSLLPEL